ncbi:allophanate hydrolase [Pseudonocardia xinjiangensis]|uniref:allophanate hydrolase n=1 Tax=Pseudonocardia xinjiangensis TaxID=75289 RepID=UPI003D8A8D51
MDTDLYTRASPAGGARERTSSSHLQQVVTGGKATDRVTAAYALIDRLDRPEVWIHLREPEAVLDEAAALDARAADGEELPLHGVLVAVKDNIDVAGLPTTAACPSFVRLPEMSAPAVSRLTQRGAIVLGKTNLDQFATGLTGSRSPYGAVRCAGLPDRISGGSSSGSAVAVALGIVDLALGTDTAGSGRVPAAVQGIVGLKPTIGLVPTSGVVPAARSYDCVSVFAAGVGAAEHALAAMSGPAPDRPWRPIPADAPLAAPAHPTVAVPLPSDLAGMSAEQIAAFDAACHRLAAQGVTIVPIDVEPFLAAGRLLYGGALVAERYAAVGGAVESGGDEIDPSVRAIIGAARTIPAHRLVADLERLDQLKVAAAQRLTGMDALLLPTVPEHPTLAEVAQDPIGVNTRLGRFTTFANLLDMAAIAVPAGTADGGPFGVSVLAPAFADRVVADIARLVTGEPAGTAPAPTGLPLFVVGAHLSGQPLNGQLSGARLIRPERTSPEYRLFDLGTTPARPGLVRTGPSGRHINGELWSLPPAVLGELLASLPAPLALGPLTLAGGETVTGFLCDRGATEHARDISEHGGWRAYRAATAAG